MKKKICIDCKWCVKDPFIEDDVEEVRRVVYNGEMTEEQEKDIRERLNVGVNRCINPKHGRKWANLQDMRERGNLYQTEMVEGSLERGELKGICGREGKWFESK